jgi:hypothetical protein
VSLRVYVSDASHLAGLEVLLFVLHDVAFVQPVGMKWRPYDLCAAAGLAGRSEFVRLLVAMLTSVMGHS